MKEILIIYYSQSGQLLEILKNVAANLQSDKINITYYNINPTKPYPFPWSGESFYGVFPETFLQIPCDLQPTPEKILSKKYDLVILGYTVWYLTPSIPINSFLKLDSAKTLLANSPVITLVACRNMWIMAQEKVKKMLLDCKANLVGHIALTDRNVNHLSVITIEYWMMTGRKDRKWGIFPKPGVSNEDIKNADIFGIPIKNALLKNDFSNLQEQLINLNAVKIKPLLIPTDQRGNVVFSKWANLLIKKQGDNRRKWLVVFKYYLHFAIWVIAPIVFIVFLLTYIPSIGKIKRQKSYYQSVALKTD